MSTKIEWVRNADGTPGETWNPTVGCSRVSPGCDHCYAVNVVTRGMQEAHRGLAVDGDWTGEIRCLPDRLDVPLKRVKPTTWFVGSLSDLFHRDVPLDFFAQVWDVMTRTPRHTYLLLTKRPHRVAKVLGPRGIGFYAVEGPVPRPQPNIWIGASTESQEWADHRVPQILAAPNALPWLSVEPMVGAVDLSRWLYVELMDALGPPGSDKPGWGLEMFAALAGDRTKIGWVVAGGESGAGARPMHPEWVRTLREQCLAAEVPFFFKQWGSWAPSTQETYDEQKRSIAMLPDGSILPAMHTPVDDPDEPDTAFLDRIGKKAAGRELDGRTWDELPERAA